MGNSMRVIDYNWALERNIFNFTTNKLSKCGKSFENNVVFDASTNPK